MNKEELKQKLIKWCQEQGAWAAQEEFAEAEMDFALTLHALTPSQLAIEASEKKGEDWILLQHSMKISKDFVDASTSTGATMEHSSFNQLIDNIVNTRAASLRGETQSSSNSYLVIFSYPIYLDGLTKHGFISALDELSKTRKMLDTIVNQMHQQREEIAKLKESFAQVQGERERAIEKIEKKSLLDVPATTDVGTITTTGAPATNPERQSSAKRECPRCRAVLPESASFCASCGIRVGAAVPVPSTPVRPTPTERRCARCGQVVPPGKTFCTGCGTRL